MKWIKFSQDLGICLLGLAFMAFVFVRLGWENPKLDLRWISGDTLAVRVAAHPFVEKQRVERIVVYWEIPSQELRRSHEIVWREGLEDTTLFFVPPRHATTVGAISYRDYERTNGAALRQIPKRRASEKSV